MMYSYHVSLHLLQILLLGAMLMAQSQGTYSKGLFTQDMFAMVQHEEGSILVGRVYVGHIHDVHLTVRGQLLITSPRPLHPCTRTGTKLQQMIAKCKAATTTQGLATASLS